MNSIISAKKIQLSKIKGCSESAIQHYILKNLDVLELGSLSVVSIEKDQKFKHEIDALLMKDNSNIRYILDITVGTREAIEINRFYSYCEFEKNDKPQFDYCAIIICDGVTKPFLEAIKIFNGVVPLIAFEVSGYESKLGDQFVVFNKVIDSFSDNFKCTEYSESYKNSNSNGKVRIIYSERNERKIPTGFKLEKEHYTWNEEQGYYIKDRSTDLVEVIDCEMIDMLSQENSITFDEEE